MKRTQLNIFDRPYPDSPGFQARDTSYQAAREVQKRKDHKRQVHEDILELLQAQPMTADEIATALRLSILYVRPRVTELATDYFLAGQLIRPARIRDSGERRKNLSGKSAAVWELVNAERERLR